MKLFTPPPLSGHALLSYAALLLVSLGPTAGAASATRVAPPPPADAAQQEETLELLGRVVLIPVEGEFYGIVTADGSRYVPLDLDPLYQQDGLALRLRAEPVRNMLGIHMWGSYIRVLEAIPSACLEENAQIKDNCPSP